MEKHLARPAHQVAYEELAALLKKHTDAKDLTAPQLLAVAANMVGKLIALQDQRSMSLDLAMTIVARNIEHGNEEIRRQLLSAGGTPQ